ncbi:hypothetical protein GQ55_5G343200 [Panicum hallii var. hallii]|uniref:Uncharacterized protein n=1 Tax=Panicum hallii var. hallii TaxID=1504633 RepID=A0A2T7DM53_9POAL|nr:hypothetical protein GQ55_5G343200 [Panicum hallii var. hallii]
MPTPTHLPLPLLRRRSNRRRKKNRRSDPRRWEGHPAPAKPAVPPAPQEAYPCLCGGAGAGCRRGGRPRPGDACACAGAGTRRPRGCPAAP